MVGDSSVRHLDDKVMYVVEAEGSLSSLRRSALGTHAVSASVPMSKGSVVTHASSE